MAYQMGLTKYDDLPLSWWVDMNTVLTALDGKNALDLQPTIYGSIRTLDGMFYAKTLNLFKSI